MRRWSRLLIVGCVISVGMVVYAMVRPMLTVETEEHIRRGVFYISLERFADAIEELEHALEQDPTANDARVPLAKLYARERNWDRAAAVLEAAVQHDPTSTDAWMLRGFVALKQQDLPTAREAFTQLTVLTPDSFDAYHQLARLQLAVGDGVAARETITLFLATHPGHAAARWSLAGFWLLDGDLERAKEAYASLVAEHPDSVLLLDRLAAIYTHERDYTKAIETLEAIVAAHPQLAPAHVTLGMLNEQRGDVEAAMTAYHQAIDISDALYVPYNNLANLYVNEQDDVDAALPLAARAYALAPERPEVADTLGWVHVRRGELSEAEALLQRAVEVLPEHPAVLYHVGVLRYQQGRYPAARRALTTALQLDIANDDAMQARLLLDAMRWPMSRETRAQ